MLTAEVISQVLCVEGLNAGISQRLIVLKYMEM